mgnify:CR=1 FL=1
MASFIEYQFPPGISYGSSGGPVFNTTVNMTKSGMETRQINWQYARHKYNVTYGIRNQADFDAVIKLFHAVQGRATGFRFKDWSDFKSCDIAATPAATDQLIGAGDGATKTFQLIKKYSIGGVSNARTIKKPVGGSVLVALNNVVQGSGWTADTTTGIIAFTNAPGNGVSVTAGFQFDVPVRFDVDELSIVLSKPQLSQTQITLIEDMNA